MRIARNNEGVELPDDPHVPSPGWVAREGLKLQEGIATGRAIVERVLRAEIGRRHQIICAVARSDKHWLAAIPAWKQAYPDVRIDPSKRILTACQYLYGPDRLNSIEAAASAGPGNLLSLLSRPASHTAQSTAPSPAGGEMKQSKRRTYKLAHRRSYVHIALIRRGVPPHQRAVEEYLAHIATPEVLIEETKAWIKAGRPAALPANTATGITSNGRPLQVRVKDNVATIIEEGTGGPRSLRATQLPSPNGGTIIDIDGFNEDQPPSAPEPEVLPGVRVARLIASPSMLERLSKADARPVLVRARSEPAGTGPLTVTLVEVRHPAQPTAASAAVAKGTSAGHQGSPVGAASLRAGSVVRPPMTSAKRPATAPRAGCVGQAKRPLPALPQPSNRPAMKPGIGPDREPPKPSTRPAMNPRLGPNRLTPPRKP